MFIICCINLYGILSYIVIEDFDGYNFGEVIDVSQD